MKKIFISYGVEDAERAEALAQCLETAGSEPFTRSEIDAGANWNASILQQVVDSDVLLVLWSRAALASPWVRSEIGYAFSSSTPVVFVVADDTQLPAHFEQYPRLTLDDPELGELLAREGLIDNAKRGSFSAAGRAPERTSRNRGYAFISRADEDIQPKHALVQFLRVQGYAYWEYTSSRRAYDAHLFLEIEDKIKEAALALIIISNAWKKSTWALREFSFCEEIKKPHFLLRFDQMEPTLAIAGIPWIDFVRDRGVGFSELERELREVGL